MNTIAARVFSHLQRFSRTKLSCLLCFCFIQLPMEQNQVDLGKRNTIIQPSLIADKCV